MNFMGGGGECRLVQPSQQHVAPYVKGVEWGSDTRGLRMVAAFRTCILVSSAYTVEITQQAGVISRRRRAAIRTPF